MKLCLQDEMYGMIERMLTPQGEQEKEGRERERVRKEKEPGKRCDVSEAVAWVNAVAGVS